MIPTFVSIQRFLRPYVKFLVFWLWIYVRVILPHVPASHFLWNNRQDDTLSHDSIYNNRTANTQPMFRDADHRTVVYIHEASSYFHQMGLLDILHRMYTLVQSHILKEVTKMTDSSAYHVILSTFFLYMNDFMGLLLLLSIASFLQSIRRMSWVEWKEDVVQILFDWAKVHIPMVKRELLKEEAKLEADLKKSMWKGRKTIRRMLPKEGVSPNTILESFRARVLEENQKWHQGRVSGTVYSGEEFLTKLHTQIFELYALSNPLHVDVWPSVCQCEAEIISMTAHLLNGGDEGIVGAVTSGGTESIVLAVRAHLHVYGKNRGIRHPEIIAGDTAHAGLDKACDMFHIRLIKIPCRKENGYRLGPKEVEKHMGPDVIMIYASAPSYPQGVIDPIEDLSKIAVKYNIGMHVDACLGGFVLPFARMMKYEIPKFDFECLGVTSMSADTHKYGYASKGTSVVLYRTKELRRAQYFSYAKWMGGIYGTPTIAGSRSGALIACAWASLVAVGEEGYKHRVKLIMDTTRKIALGISEIDGLCLLGGDPKSMICCFASDNNFLNIYAVSDAMTSLGWSLNALQNPASIHICVTLNTVDHVDSFLNDLKIVVRRCLDITNNGKSHGAGSAAIYGMTGTLPKGPVNDLVKAYTDINLSC